METETVKQRPTEEWLLAHRDYPHDKWCLVWPFAREPRVGRGMGGMNGRRGWAHRFMCELAHGPAPEGKPQAAHSCGSGDQGCVNPRHLYWANNSQNQLDRTAHGRAANGKQHKFTPQQIAEIRSKYGEFTQTKLAEMYDCSLGTIQYYLKYRETRGHAGGLIEHWMPDEDAKLRDALSRNMSFSQAAKFVGRSPGAVYSRSRRLGLKSSFAVTQSNGVGK